MKNKTRYNLLFWDVDTQNDFMDKNGALYVPDAEKIKPNLEKLTQYAGDNFILVYGSVDKHFGTEEYKNREKELQRNGGPFPDHCMAKTYGQEKIKETSLGTKRDAEKYIRNPLKITEKFLHEALKISMLPFLARRFKRNLAIFFEKQNYDVFTNPLTEKFLECLRIKKVVVYGVATDYCVKAAVLGMQKRGIQCYVVEDAIKGVAPETTKSALEEMVKAGAKFVKTKNVLKGKIK